ncbi:MAG: hypothetical protein AAGJ92_11610 [Pseudomonadota bacterium]
MRMRESDPDDTERRRLRPGNLCEASAGGLDPAPLQPNRRGPRRRGFVDRHEGSERPAAVSIQSASSALMASAPACLLAYASDLNLLGTALRPHGQTWFTGKVMAASLDHAMWFHAPAAFCDWHLYTMDSPWAGHGRGFNRGKIYDRDGRLIASVAQEGLMRPVVPRGQGA